MAVKENIEEAEDFDFAEYNFKPQEIIINDKTVIDYTGIEHDKIYLVNKKDILSKPRPSWLPELNADGLMADDFLPVCVKDFSDGNYFVQSKIKSGEKDKIRYGTVVGKEPVWEKHVYKMSPDLLTATVDYYLKHKRAELKAQGSTKKVALPRALKSMPSSRYYDMAELLSYCKDISPEVDGKHLGNNPELCRKDLKRGSRGYKLQNQVLFIDQWQPLLQSIKDKKLDMNLQKQDMINAFDKGEETSYGRSNRSNGLYEKYGVKIKKQNGSTFSSQERQNLETTLDNVWNHFGSLKELASNVDLTLSYADNCNQHARKAIGVYRYVPDSEEKSIGVSFFNDDSMSASITLSHEVTHWLDSEKGLEQHHHFASDIEGTLENKIATKFKELIRQNIKNEKNKNTIGVKSTGPNLGDYWFRTCECLARAMEEHYALVQGIGLQNVNTKGVQRIFDSDPAYLPEKQFVEEIEPLCRELIEDNRKHFNIASVNQVPVLKVLSAINPTPDLSLEKVNDTVTSINIFNAPTELIYNKTINYLLEDGYKTESFNTVVTETDSRYAGNHEWNDYPSFDFCKNCIKSFKGLYIIPDENKKTFQICSNAYFNTSEKYKNLEKNYLNDNLEIEIENKYSGLKAKSYYNSKETRELCHIIKSYNQSEEYVNAIGKIADYISSQGIIDKDSILVPAPNHSGIAEYTEQLAQAIYNRTGASICDCLRCKPHDTLYDQKKMGNEPELELYLEDNIAKRTLEIWKEKGCKVYFIDNNISTGLTFNKAAELIPGIIPAPFAIGNFAEIEYKDGLYHVNNLLEEPVNEISESENYNLDWLVNTRGCEREETAVVLHKLYQIFSNGEAFERSKVLPIVFGDLKESKSNPGELDFNSYSINKDELENIIGIFNDNLDYHTIWDRAWAIRHGMSKEDASQLIEWDYSTKGKHKFLSHETSIQNNINKNISVLNEEELRKTEITKNPELSDNGKWVLNEASNGMLSKYIDSDDIEQINDFRTFVASCIKGIASDKSYFPQMFIYGEIWNDNHILRHKELNTEQLDLIKDYYKKPDASPKYILSVYGKDIGYDCITDFNKRQWIYTAGDDIKELINIARTILSSRKSGFEGAYINSAVDYFTNNKGLHTVYNLDLRNKSSIENGAALIHEYDETRNVYHANFNSLKDFNEYVEHENQILNARKENTNMEQLSLFEDENEIKSLSNPDFAAFTKLGFVEVNNKDEIKDVIKSCKEYVKSEYEGYYQNINSDNCTIYRLNGNVPLQSEKRANHRNDETPLYAICMNGKYSVIQSKVEENPHHTYYHEENFPSALSLFLTIGRKTNLSESESRKALWVKCPNSNVEILSEQLYSLNLLSNADKDFYKNLKSDNLFHKGLKELILKNEIENKIEENTQMEKPYSFIVKDTAEFEQFADFEPLLNLTAKEAVDKYCEIRKKGLSAGIAISIPGDFIFGEHPELGVCIVVDNDGKADFKIYGDTFIEQLTEKQVSDGRARKYIDCYKELFTAFEQASIPVNKPDFVFEKEKELFNNAAAIDEKKVAQMNDRNTVVQVSNDEWNALVNLADKAQMDWFYEETFNQKEFLKGHLEDLAEAWLFENLEKLSEGDYKLAKKVFEECKIKLNVNEIPVNYLDPIEADERARNLGYNFRYNSDNPDNEFCVIYRNSDNALIAEYSKLGFVYPGIVDKKDEISKDIENEIIALAERFYSFVKNYPMKSNAEEKRENNNLKKQTEFETSLEENLLNKLDKKEAELINKKLKGFTYKDMMGMTKKVLPAKEQLEENIFYVIGGLENFKSDRPDEFTPYTKEQLRKEVTSEIYDMVSDGAGSVDYADGICSHLKFLGNEYIYSVIDKIGSEAGLLIEDSINISESQNTSVNKSENTSLNLVPLDYRNDNDVEAFRQYVMSSLPDEYIDTVEARLILAYACDIDDKPDQLALKDGKAYCHHFEGNSSYPQKDYPDEFDEAVEDNEKGKFVLDLMQKTLDLTELEEPLQISANIEYTKKNLEGIIRRSELPAIIPAEENWKQDKELLEAIKIADKSSRPTTSEWGKVDGCHKLIPGVYSVDTASHGGILVHTSVAEKVLSPETLESFKKFRDGNFYSFEEDCDANIVLVELYRKHLFEGYKWNDGKQGQYYELAQKSIRKYYPDYYEIINSIDNKTPVINCSLENFDTNAFFERYSKNYDYYYNAEDDEIIDEERTNMRFFDSLLDNNKAFLGAVQKLVTERHGDPFSSDRECAAVVKTFHDLGIELSVKEPEIEKTEHNEITHKPEEEILQKVENLKYPWSFLIYAGTPEESINELKEHLSSNGYDFIIDKIKDFITLKVPYDIDKEIETILEDRDIDFAKHIGLSPNGYDAMWEKEPLDSLVVTKESFQKLQEEKRTDFEKNNLSYVEIMGGESSTSDYIEGNTIYSIKEADSVLPYLNNKFTVVNKTDVKIHYFDEDEKEYNTYSFTFDLGHGYPLYSLTDYITMTCSYPEVLEAHEKAWLKSNVPNIPESDLSLFENKFSKERLEGFIEEYNQHKKTLQDVLEHDSKLHSSWIIDAGMSSASKKAVAVEQENCGKVFERYIKIMTQDYFFLLNDMKKLDEPEYMSLIKHKIHKAVLDVKYTESRNAVYGDGFDYKLWRSSLEKAPDGNKIDELIENFIQENRDFLKSKNIETKVENNMEETVKESRVEAKENKILPFDIINNEEKGRVNIKFNPARENPFFDDILKELKANGWKYAPSTRLWYPINIKGSTEFAENLQEKYTELLTSHVLENIENKLDSVSSESVNINTNSVYDGIKFFDRNYEEAKDFQKYYSENKEPISIKEAKTILAALNHKEVGTAQTRTDRLGLDADNNLVVVTKIKDNVQLRKTNPEELLVIAKDMAEHSVIEAKQMLDSYKERNSFAKDKNLQDIFSNLYETCFEDSVSVRDNMNEVYDRLINIGHILTEEKLEEQKSIYEEKKKTAEEKLKENPDNPLAKAELVDSENGISTIDSQLNEKKVVNKKQSFKPLNIGDVLGEDHVEDVFEIAKGIYQATLVQGDSGIFGAGSYFVLDKSISDNLSEEVRKLLEDRDSHYVIENKRFEPYVIKELVEKHIMPPRDENYVQQLTDYINLHPLKYANLYPVDYLNFKDRLRELSIIDKDLKKSSFELGQQLISMVDDYDKARLNKWLISEGCTSKENMAKVFDSWISGKEQKLENTKKKDNGYPPRGE